MLLYVSFYCFFFQAEDGIRDLTVTGVQTCALPICLRGPVAFLILGQTLRRVTRVRLTSPPAGPPSARGRGARPPSAWPRRHAELGLYIQALRVRRIQCIQAE